ncbi:MAG: monofunctional biosynthetic peptidoglycan transglycosylase [Prevotella sp.]|nr:monofunctional biosynthetic peptidoglycan transglycosylase [Prevotellaceae bacterium]MDY4891454.1 monofunctional biosynthetic peptidoglycan transglycosylase [Prevotella sp.]MDY6198999.1 monofunctional biosynthetic peptidoglycan transglycosylase [Prevotella sp.]
MIIISKLKTIVKWMVVAFFGSTILAVVTLRFMPVYFTPLMFIRVGQQITSGESIKLKHHWVSIDEMAKDMPLAVMSSEDQRFLIHHGFDFDAIQQAAKENREGKRKRGASTISQQTAKNVFLWPGRTWLRKGLETYFTFLIEALWSKQRIMEVYLNSIEMGNGIYGAEAVAQEHFGCKASQLTRKQCALIAATLPNPRKFNSAAPSPYMKKRQRRIVKEMNYMEKNMDADISKHYY